MVDLDTMNKRKQKRLAKSIIDEDQGLNRFDISRKIQKIMVEQPKKKSKKDEEEVELLAWEQRKKTCDYCIFSYASIGHELSPTKVERPK